jgi:hypothetical protein
MAKGSLKLRITDVVDAALDGEIHVDFEPARESPGGASMDAHFQAPGATDFTISDLECRGGPGTLYQVTITSPNYRMYSFFQLVLEGQVNKSSDNQIRMIVNPKKVKDITSLSFAGLHPKLREFLGNAAPIVKSDEDRDIQGLSGAALYDRLGPLRRACMLNLFAKAKHGSSGRSFSFLRKLLLMHQDRCFCTVDPALKDFLVNNERFKSAPNLLHKPLEGFELGPSFKSRDAHANIQFTLQRNTSTNEWAADVDIDEATGIEHGFEVIRNAVSQGRTNPYLVRDLLVLTDPVEKTLDPGYRFVYR